jgi:hypothetical protein
VGLDARSRPGVERRRGPRQRRPGSDQFHVKPVACRCSVCVLRGFGSHVTHAVLFAPLPCKPLLFRCSSRLRCSSACVLVLRAAHRCGCSLAPTASVQSAACSPGATVLLAFRRADAASLRCVCACVCLLQDDQRGS